MKRFAIAVMCTMLASCASIPLGTIWKMSSFSQDDLVLLDPSSIGAAVELPDTVPLNSEEIRLRVEVRPASAAVNSDPVAEANSSLLLRDRGRDVHAQLPASGSGRGWYLLALSEDGVAEFRRFQKELAALLADEEQEYGYRLMVSNTFRLPEDMQEEFETSVWLNLDEPEDWFALVDRHAFDPVELRENGKTYE